MYRDYELNGSHGLTIVSRLSFEKTRLIPSLTSIGRGVPWNLSYMKKTRLFLLCNEQIDNFDYQNKRTDSYFLLINEGRFRQSPNM